MMPSNRCLIVISPMVTSCKTIVQYCCQNIDIIWVKTGIFLSQQESLVLPFYSHTHFSPAFTSSLIFWQLLIFSLFLLCCHFKKTCNHFFFFFSRSTILWRLVKGIVHIISLFLWIVEWDYIVWIYHICLTIHP